MAKRANFSLKCYRIYKSITSHLTTIFASFHHHPAHLTILQSWKSGFLHILPFAAIVQ
jgi:hypothetical protein